MWNLTGNLPGRERLSRLLRRPGGPDPVASALAESEVRALSPAILPEIEAILAKRVTGIEDILRTAAQAIIGSGIIASALESVRENPRFLLPIAGAAGSRDLKFAAEYGNTYWPIGPAAAWRGG